VSAEREAFARRLEEGAGPSDASLAQRLGLDAQVDDRALGAALAAAVAAQPPVLAVAEAEPARSGPAPADSSFLGRLGAGGRDVASLDDLATLFAVLEGGTLAQRRAAARRLEARVRTGDLTPEQLEEVEQALAAPRDADVAWEVLRARAALPGAAGRDVRDADDAFEQLSARLLAAVRAFWEEEGHVEPLAALPAEDLAVVALRARELPDEVAAHVCAVLEGADGASDLAARTSLAGALRSANDPRLLPALVALTTDRAPELARAAVRALGRVEDPRARTALVRAFERSGDAVTRALAGGSLGLVGDPRALPLLRELLDGGDRRAQRAAAEGLVELATMDDVDRLLRLVSHEDRSLVRQVVRTLGRIGDGRAYAPLLRRRDAATPDLVAEIDVAVRSIAAQMELRGEGKPSEPTSASSTARRSAVASDVSGRGARLRAWLELTIGRLWLWLGAIDRALAAFESAAGRRPGWGAPHAAIAMAQVRRGRAASALAAFRRALSSDRDYIEAHARIVREMARAFLRRAEEMERAGRRDIALGLLEELLAIDLRRVDEPVRFEIVRRTERLRAEAA
jgi:HEAT repeat protein